MTDDLRRLRDDASLPADLRAALDAGVDDRGAPREVAALEAAVLAAIVAGGGGGGGGGAAAAKAAASWGPYALAGGLVAASIAGAVWSSVPSEEALARTAWRESVEEARARVGETTDAPTSQDAGVVEAADTAVPDVPALEAVEATRPRPRAVPVETSEVEPPAASPEMLDELALVREARRLLSSDPAGALAITERMRAVSSPAWSEERERIAIEALHRLGRAPEARRRFLVFARDYPSSAYRARLEEILGAP